MPNPWDNDPIVQPGNNGPTVTPLPMSPKDRAREGRDIEAADRDKTVTGIKVRDEGRSIDNRRFDEAQKLRESFEQREPVKRYRTILNQYAAGIGSDATPAGDQQLINAYAQMLNPTSTVMLGEYQATEQIDPVLQQVKNRLMKEFGWDGAGRISDSARKQLRDEMFGLTVNANMAYNQDRGYFEGLATQYGYEPNEVVGPHIGDPFKQDIEQHRLGMKQSEAMDSYTAIGPRGEKIVFEVPPGSSEADIRELAVAAAKNPALRGSTVEGPPTGYQDSYLGQGMSGVNEGIASTLGGPVDLLTAGLNLIPEGINAVAGTDLPTIQDPFLGSGTFRSAMTSPGNEAIYDRSSDPAKQFTRRVGQSVGAAALPGAAAGSLPRMGAAMLGGAGGGVGAATAQRVAPGNPLAEFAGEMIGGGVTGAGLFAGAKRNATREIEAAVPTVPQLKDQAGGLYRQAEARGVTAGPMQTQELRDAFEATLRREGQLGPQGKITDADTNTTKAFNLVDQYANQPMRPAEMDTVRGVIAEGRKSADSSDQRLSGILTEQFDDWARPMAPEFDQARDVSSRYLQAEDLEEARELARASASQFGNSGLENAIRTQYRGLDRGDIRGRNHFAPDVTEAIQNVSRGTPGSNFARNLGRFAPTGPVSLATSVGIPALAGGTVGGGIGAAIGGSLGLAGAGGRVAANAMTNRAVDVAELVARNGGRLPEATVMTPELERAIASLAAAETAKYTAPPKKEKPRRGLFGR
ncbi:MAG: hypothetical protein V4696_13395 [Pseudomonadota bacterium]